ncbi:MAG: class I tRNA ligase family protein, partial [Firmicutes bacterium]|nr:class I tRNA ligase family protein [Bacillota bacterium]
VGVAKLMAPLAPFITVEIYTNLTGEDTVHTAFFPKADESLIAKDVEERMDLVRTLVSLGRGIREKERIKVRQPLKEVLVDGKYEALISDLTPLIKEDLNVKEVKFDSDLDKFMNFSLKPNFRLAGPYFGKNVKAFGNYIANADPKAFISEIESKGEMEIELDGTMFTVNKDLLDIRIEAREGFSVAMENNVFAILDTSLDQELIDEGFARELISKVQQIRKAQDLEMMDNIDIFIEADQDILNAVDIHRDYIMSETLALDVAEQTGLEDTYDLNGHKTGIKVVKIDK